MRFVSWFHLAYQLYTYSSNSFKEKILKPPTLRLCDNQVFILRYTISGHNMVISVKFSSLSFFFQCLLSFRFNDNNSSATWPAWCSERTWQAGERTSNRWWTTQAAAHWLYNRSETTLGWVSVLFCLSITTSTKWLSSTVILSEEMSIYWCRWHTG